MVVIYVKWMNTTAIAKQTLKAEIVDLSDLENLTDSQLYKKCQEYGLNAKRWLRKFAGLLPEVSKRRLYKRRECASIYQFAAKLAGMSERNVDKILSIYEKIKDKPNLRKLFISGEVSWVKLEMVAYVSTKETENKWAEKVVDMPSLALQVFVQEYRKRESKQPVLTKPNLVSYLTDIGQVECKDEICQNPTPNYEDTLSATTDLSTLNNQEWARFSCILSPEIEFKLRMRKQQIEKHKRETLSWNEVFTEITKNWDMTSPMQRKIPKEKIIDWGTY